jgi:hypothetical protein
MGMARKSKTEQEQGYLRSYWDEIREMEHDFMGVATCSMEGTPRPGVLRIRLSFTPFAGDEYNSLGVSTVVLEYPNAQQGSLASTLWAASLKLLQLVESAKFRARELQAS